MKEGEFASKRGPRWFVVKPDIISYNTVLSTFQEPADAVSLLHEVSTILFVCLFVDMIEHIL